MSRIGKMPIALNDKVNVNYVDGKLTVKGKNGELKYNTPVGVDLEITKDEIKIKSDFSKPDGRRLGGTARVLIGNMVHGVSEGWEKNLELVGVGYRAQVSGKKITLSLGFSHPIEYILPEQVSAQIDSNTKIKLSSCDKQALGQTAAEIRKYRPPEPYKGKGVLFANEQIRRKAGKTAKGSK